MPPNDEQPQEDRPRTVLSGKPGADACDRLQNWRADAHFEKHRCRWNQNPLETVARSPLTVVEFSTAFLGIITAIEARPE